MAALRSRRIGLMCQPGSHRPTAGLIWAADNGCFGGSWDEGKWRRWLADLPRAGCLFAVVPDVVGDAVATTARFCEHHRTVRSLRYPVAYVAQDGIEALAPPWDDFDALFIGGSTEWKMSEHAYRVAAEAHERGKWVHVGRVNSETRFKAWAAHADSADGTFLAFGPKVNLPRLLGWVDRHDQRPQLWEVCGSDEPL